jgi:transcription elongation factor Elf1
MKNIDEEVKLGGLGEDYPKPILIEDLGTMYPTEKSKERKRYGLYKCGFCGSEFRTQTSLVKSGHTKSCGCYNKRRTKETNTKHGLGATRLYVIWVDMRMRTLNPNHKSYNNYGGRGITLCDEWLDVQNFWDWAMSNGYSDELSIDRIDNDDGYSPENCRWVGGDIQARNQRIQKNNTSGYKGVCRFKDTNMYMARITINNKRIYLGLFPTAEDGAIAYNNYIIENNLEGFILNEIPEGYENG